MSDHNTKKVAVVTGAGRGIGKGIAIHLAQQGIHVICVSQSIFLLGSRSGNHRGRVFAQAMQVDVACKESVQQACEQLLNEHGIIDILVNNAGIT